MIDLYLLFERAKTVAKTAGLRIRELEKNRKIFSAQGKDIKTLADKESEKIILEGLSDFSIPFLSEESGDIGVANDEGYRWIIDPLDGTFNYSRGFKHYCVSIAFWKNNDPIFGVIYNIPEDVLYSGFVGKGAWKSGKPLRPIKNKAKQQSSLLTGFPLAFEFSERNLKGYLINMKDYKKIRMIGSAALSLAYVAEGVFDAYQEKNIFIWDVAAGIAIVKALNVKMDIVMYNSVNITLTVN